MYWKSAQQKLVLCENPEIHGKDIGELIQQLPQMDEFPMFEAMMPLCYQHVEGVWDICDIVIYTCLLCNKGKKIDTYTTF